jgi:hypothetical protein
MAVNGHPYLAYDDYEQTVGAKQVKCSMELVKTYIHNMYILNVVHSACHQSRCGTFVVISYRLNVFGICTSENYAQKWVDK